MSPIETAVRTVVGLLVKGQYDVLEAMTRGRWLPADAIAEAIREYGRTLVDPGADWWSTVDVLPSTLYPTSVHVAAPLWTKEEGRSDLTVELQLERTRLDVYDIELLNIHVL